MEYRKHQGWAISEIGIGCYALSGAYGTKDPQEFARMLGRAHELGVNFFDTADAYGDAEGVLGKAIKPFRHEVYVATKVGVQENASFDLSPAYVKAACEQSLQRLQTDYVDLYQVHFDDPTTPVAETVGALEELASAGKIRRYGVGHLPPERVKTYLTTSRVFSVLTELSAVARAACKELLPLCQAHGVGVIGFSVAGRGILTGKIKQRPAFEASDIRNVDPLFQRERFQSAVRVAEKLGELGRRHAKTPVQAAIAWVLSQPGVVCALTGPSTIPHLEENLGGSGWTLSPQDLGDLDVFFEQEDAWLMKKDRASVERILSEPLPPDPSQAFTDLVYVFETAILLSLTTEEQVMPTFMRLYGMRDSLDENVAPKLKEIQCQLGELIEVG